MSEYEHHRLFFGIEIPQPVKQAIETSLRAFPQALHQMVSPDRWHITLFFLGECPDIRGYTSRLKKPIPQAFLPTVHVTHLGRGLAPNQVWAYVAPSPILDEIRAGLLERLKKMRLPSPLLRASQSFVPHIHVADLPADKNSSLASDSLIKAVFPLKEITLFESKKTEAGLMYMKELGIPLTR